MRSTVLNIRINRSLQSGQAIVLIALLILVLFGMLGLAIDSGRAYVDRRDQQTAVDAAALAAGDWFMNFHTLTDPTYGSLQHSLALYQTDLRLYGGATLLTPQTTVWLGPNSNLRQDSWTYGFAGGYKLTITTTNTQFNGYEFQYDSYHDFPLAFMGIFGGAATVPIIASATSIVGNQRQTPALLTLSPGPGCTSTLTGSANLTVLGDVYTNGQACLDANLHEAGNCYAVSGNCSAAQYYCYNAAPGFIPYPPPCAAGDTQGGPIVPAPSLPDPGYLAPSVNYYTTPQSYNQYNRGTWTEMYPGSYASFHLSGGSASCAFLDPGVYWWTGGYQSDATGSLLSNELKAPDEGLWSAAGAAGVANPQFWDQNSAGCAGHFNVTVVPAPSYGIKHQGGGFWGVAVTSMRYDQFLDTTIQPNPCAPPGAGCQRESAPSQCVSVRTDDINNSGLDVNITKNAPGAQYYAVYLDPYGCDGILAHFGFFGRYVAPGWSGNNPPATPVGPYPNGTNSTLVGGTLENLYSCPLASGVTICNMDYNNWLTFQNCWSQTHNQHCQAPDVELAPQCFSNCPPPANLLSQENAPMQLEYNPWTGGDIANENYCQPPPNPGDPNAPCQGAQITPGAVQFYFPGQSCMTQNAQGATYVFSGLQYNWIIIYFDPANSCASKLNGGASTQYIGTIYSPAASWQLNGGNRSPLAGQVICYTATVSGAAQVGIDYNPNYAPAPPAARLIN